ncbi:MAG: hypothetical protein AAF236_06075 [Verrucomicrobiota bacterium]
MKPVLGEFGRHLLVSGTSWAKLTGLILPIWVLTSLSGGEEVLKVGVAQIDVTPSPGWRLGGTFKERIATGTHDPLYVRAIVFEQAETRLAILGADVGMVPAKLGRAVRSNAEALDGWKGDNIIIHASETHHSPDYFGEFRDVFHQRAVEQNGYDPQEPEGDGDFEAVLFVRMRQAIDAAAENLRPVIHEYRETVVPNLTFNRRFEMRDGSIGWNPGKLNPAIVGPAGPVDERLTLLAFRAVESRAPAVLLPGFPLHLAIADGSEYSADFPHFLTQRIKRSYRDTFVHFLQAPCCELNHIDVSHDRPQKGMAYAAEVGDQLAEASIELLRDDSKFSEGDSLPTPLLAAKARRIRLELQEVMMDEFTEAEKLWTDPNRAESPFLDVVRAGRIYGITERHTGGPVLVLLQAFQFDAETALVALPSEVSVEIGLGIQAASPYPNTIIIQNSNDWIGYIPKRTTFEQGNYEAEVAKIEPGQGEKLEAEAISLLHELRESANSE